MSVELIVQQADANLFQDENPILHLEAAILLYSKAFDFKIPEGSPLPACIYGKRGFAYMQLGRNDEALKDFSKSIELNPQSAESYNNRANVYNMKGMFAEAISDLEKSIGLNPGIPTAYAHMGDALAALGKKEEALENYQKAIKLVEAKTIAERNYTDYFAAIRAKKGLGSLGFGISSDYELEALERGMLTYYHINTVQIPKNI